MTRPPLSDAPTPAEIAAEIEAVRKLPRIEITIAEALKLPEYSTSSPTGRAPGTRWRRHNGKPNGFSAGAPWPHWLICEYGPPEPHPHLAGAQVLPIKVYRAVIRVRAELHQ